MWCDRCISCSSAWAWVLFGLVLTYLLLREGVNKMKPYVKRVGIVLFAALAVAAASGGMALSSFTFPTNPTGGGMASLGNGVLSWITGTGIPIFLGLVALGIVLRLIVRLVKRGARAV